MLARLFAAGLVLALAVPAFAQGQRRPAARRSADPRIRTGRSTFEEQVVVTASRAEQQLVNAPAAVSVITTADDPELAGHQHRRPAARRARHQRHPGHGARREHHHARRHVHAGHVAAGARGRPSVYLDFFGMVMWDLVPTNANEIKQIEVIRGPASAVWGANAMSGVVNVITKSPRELAAERRHRR